jgi:pimeloyl-ACP methyl ester carboxylesterase
MGGAIVLELILMAPNLVDKLVLGCTAASFAHPKKASTGLDSLEVRQAAKEYYEAKMRPQSRAKDREEVLILNCYLQW